MLIPRKVKQQPRKLNKKNEDQKGNFGVTDYAQ